MAYRRRQGNPRPATYEDYRSSPVAAEDPPSLAAQAIHGSSANRESSLSSAYSESAISPSSQSRPSSTYLKDSNVYEYTSLKSINDNETKSGFWGVLARKAKSIIDDDKAYQQFENLNKFKPHKLDASTNNQQYHEFHQPRESSEGQRKKRLDSLATSLYNIGGKVGNALEEGFSIVENRTADIIQETRKLNIRRKERAPDMQNLGTEFTSLNDAVQIQRDQETQLKASRDVANAMAAKAKLLLRELKTVKADLAFAKERSTQLEEENKVLRESRDKEDQLQDDDLEAGNSIRHDLVSVPNNFPTRVLPTEHIMDVIRLQLETLLAEKARLAHENSIYARENRLLREIVEYHQLTMQDVVYLDESNEEVTEVYPSQPPTISSPRKSRSPSPCISTPRALTPTVSLTRQDQLPTLPSPRTLSPQVSITPSDVVSSVVSSPPTVTGGVLETIHADIDQESLEGKKVLLEGA